MTSRDVPSRSSPTTPVGRLRATSVREGVSGSELLRRGADLVLRQDPQDTPQERRRRALAVVGGFVDEPRVAAEHDRCLDEAFGT